MASKKPVYEILSGSIIEGKVQKCSACGLDHKIKFKPVKAEKYRPGLTHEGICEHVKKPVYLGKIHG